MKKASNFFENLGESLKSIGEIVALILLLYHILHDIESTNEKTILIIAICILGISAIITVVFSFRKGHYKRNAKIAKALPSVNAAFSAIHSMSRKSEIKPENYVITLTEFCNHISEAFYKITGKNCHVSIKISVLNGPDAKLCVRTIARKREHVITDHRKPLRSGYDKKRHTQHYIEENSDFEEINENYLTNKPRYFFCNNLPKLDNYKNSSFKFHSMKATGPSKKQFWKFWRKQEWPLPYKSTMVAAICPDISERNPDDKLVGFLCIDCDDKNVFVEDEDIHLLIGCANGLYNVISDSKKTDDKEPGATGVTTA